MRKPVCGRYMTVYKHKLEYSECWPKRQTNLPPLSAEKQSSCEGVPQGRIVPEAVVRKQGLTAPSPRPAPPKSTSCGRLVADPS